MQENKLTPELKLKIQFILALRKEAGIEYLGGGEAHVRYYANMVVQLSDSYLQYIATSYNKTVEEIYLEVRNYPSADKKYEVYSTRQLYWKGRCDAAQIVRGMKINEKAFEEFIMEESNK